MASENVDLNNCSAFMIHHVMKHPNAAKRKKKLKLKHKMKCEQPKGKRQRLKPGKPSNNTVKKFIDSDEKGETSDSTISSGMNSTTAFEEHFRNKSLFQWIINPVDMNDFMRYTAIHKLFNLYERYRNISVCLQSLLGE